MRKACFIVWMLLVFFVVEAQNHIISGYVTDQATQEVLIGATVLDSISGKGASTNSYGFYSLTLPAGNVKVRFRSMGYDAQEQAFILTGNKEVNISLLQSTSELEEIVITSDQHNMNMKHGAVRVPIEKISNTPVLFGESDLMKSLQYIPGVQQATEGKSDLTVRGGSPDQNMVLLDGNPLYNINHLFGFLSVFNTDAIKNVTLYKSAFPARFGGRLSSVVDIHTRDGNKERFTGSVTAGLLAAKFTVEGPVAKDKTSFILSARRSYADLFMAKFQEWMDGEGDSRDNFYFYDLNAKLHHKFNDKTSFYLVAYNGMDHYKNRMREKDIQGEITQSTTNQDWSWGNTILAARLNRSLRGNLFMNANLSYNRYSYRTSIDEEYNLIEEETERSVHNSLRYYSGIEDYTGSLEWEYIPFPEHYVRAGAQYIFHQFRPEVFRFSENSGQPEDSGQSGSAGRGESFGYTVNSADQPSPLSSANTKIQATETALYAEDEWAATGRLILNGGLRFSLFHVKGETYPAVTPRFSTRYLLNANTSLKAGYSRMRQYIHLLSNNSLLFQTDL